MTKLIEINILGIKCDNPDCDYQDGGVDRDNYSEYVGRLCPDCDSVLLTQEDYNAVVALETIANFEIDLDFPESLLGEEKLFDVNMDGSGAVNLVEREKDEENLA